jgi:hypothetical protein
MGLSANQTKSLKALADTLCPAMAADATAVLRDPLYWSTSVGSAKSLIAKLEEVIEGLAAKDK